MAEGGATRIDLSLTEACLHATLTEAEAVKAIDADIKRIVDAARITVA